MRLIALNGAKNSRKEWVARKLADNSDCIWIKPYTDRPRLAVDYDDDEMIHLNYPKLSYKLQREEPLAVSVVNDHRYVFFMHQLRAGYCVLIADDRVIEYLKNNWDDELITVKIHSNDEEESYRFRLIDDEYDIVFNVDNDDIDELEELVGDLYHYMEGQV